MAEQGNTARSTSKARVVVAGAVQKLMEQQLLQHGKRILCYGCGKGPDVQWLRMRKFDVAGYDPFPEYGFHEMPDGLFDVVLVVFLLTRLKSDEKRREILGRAFAKVRPGGHLAVVSRNLRRHAEAAGFDGDEATADYMILLTSQLDTAGISWPRLDPEDRSETALVRRAGIYRPQLPFAWVDTPEALAAACAACTAAGLVGLDVETTLDEPRTLCTVQLAVAGQTWVVDALALEDLAPLKAVMEDEAVVKVIHNALFEQQMLATRGIAIRNIFDTLTSSRKKHKGKVSGGHKLGEVCERELNIHMDKELQTSDWTLRPLSEEQLMYAAVDAEVLLALHEVFQPPKLPETLSLFADP